MEGEEGGYKEGGVGGERVGWRGGVGWVEGGLQRGRSRGWGRGGVCDGDERGWIEEYQGTDFPC